MRLAAHLVTGLFCALLLVLGATPRSARALEIETHFDTDLEGWQPTGLDFSFTIFPPAVTDLFLKPNPGDMVHEASGGNPDGYARLTDAIETPASFAQAPAPYLGDLSGFIGGTFSFDHRLFDRGTDGAGAPAELAPYAFAIVSGDLFDLNALVFTAPAPAGNTDWVHFEIVLAPTSMGGDLMFFTDVDASVFYPDFPIAGTVGSVLNRAPTKSFEQIMASVNAVLVPFEIANNTGNQESEWAGLDNIRMASVPEPASLALLAFAGSALALARRRATARTTGA